MMPLNRYSCIPCIPCIGLLLLAVVLSGCRSTAFDIAVAGTTNQNRCEDQNRGFNTTVVLLELTSDATFLRSVSRQDFWENRTALGGDELSRTEKRLAPGEVWTLGKYKPSKEAAFLGLAANLTCPDGEGWRQVRSIGALRGRELQVEIREDRVDVSVR